LGECAKEKEGKAKVWGLPAESRGLIGARTGAKKSGGGGYKRFEGDPTTRIGDE